MYFKPIFFSSEKGLSGGQAGEVHGLLDASDLRHEDDRVLLRPCQGLAGKQIGAKATDLGHARTPEQSNFNGPLAHTGVNFTNNLKEAFSCKSFFFVLAFLDWSF